MSDVSDKLTGIGNFLAPITSIGSNIFNGLMQKRENRLNREWTEQQNDLAWQRQRQLIDEQRAYDSPKAQMQRLMDAGLNPNLIYDDLGGNMQAMNAPNAAGMYQGTAPQVDPLSLSQAMLNLSQVRKNDADVNNQNKLTTEQVKVLSKSLDVSDAQIKLWAGQLNLVNQQASNLANIDLMNSYQVDLLKYEVQKKQKTWEKEVQAEMAAADITIAEAKYAEQYFLARLNLTRSETALNTARKELAESDKKYRDEEFNLLHRTIDYLVDTAKFERDQAEALAGLEGFKEKMGTNKAIFWVNTILGWLSQSAEAAENVASTVATKKPKPKPKPRVR